MDLDLVVRKAKTTEKPPSEENGHYATLLATPPGLMHVRAAGASGDIQRAFLAYRARCVGCFLR